MEKYFDLHSADFTIRCKMYFTGEKNAPGDKYENADDSVTPFRHIVLFCHGFAGHRDNAMAQSLPAGFWKSTGTQPSSYSTGPDTEMINMPGFLSRNVTHI